MKKEQAIHNKLELREQAEEALQGHPEDTQELSEEEMQRLIYELRVHQIELEMQNEELRRTQLEIQASRNRYSDLYDFAPVGYITISEKGLIQEANLTICSMLGVGRNFLIGKRLSHFIAKDTQDIFYLHCQKLFETKVRQICELQLVKEDGSRFYAQMQSIAVQDVDDNFSQLRIAVTDITLIKQAEEEKANLQSRLQQAQKMEAIGTLAGGIAHQFNNALSPITGNIDMLKLDYHGDENIANYTKQMRDSAQRMTQLTNQLLAYARGGKYQAKNISLSDFVRDTLPLVKHNIKPSISIATNLPRDIMSVYADLTQMQIVMSAILSNSSEAIQDQGRIQVTCRNEEITDEIAKDSAGLKTGLYVTLMVEDDGKGMDEKIRSRVFEPFFTTKFQGRGLGMAAAYGIVKNHDGWISVDSEVGKGTKVCIYLPAIEVQVIEPEKPKIEPVTIKGAGTILVIEDEEMVMDVTTALLERLGYRVLGAKTGKEAIEIAKTFDGDIDLALLDILLPDMNGNAIYPHITKGRPNLKVLVFSGYSIDGPAQEILDAGAQDFIQKPFTIAELSERMKKILEAK